MLQMIKKTYSTHGALINLGIIIILLLILYQYRYGLGMLNPTYDAWVMKHDWATHHLGWFFFRFEPWSFPIGKVAHYLYPVGTNVGFTDSIPLAAIFFKLFSPILPDTFQYIGLWLFLCHVLVAFFSIKLFARFSVHGIVQLIAVLIVVLNPVLLHRSIHPAGCSHWLIIGSMWLYFMEPGKYTPSRLLAYQGLFLLLGGLINPYFSLIAAGFFVALAWRLWMFDGLISFLRASLSTVVAFSALFACWYAVGFFEFSNQGDLGVSGGYGLYAFNLNSFYNSGGWSAIHSGFPWVSWHQYESFMYLGAGMIGLLIIVGPATAIRHLLRKSTNQSPAIKVSVIPLLCFVAVISLFAITNVVSWNDKILFTIPIPNKLLQVADIFRASARYFWVAYYLILFFGIMMAIQFVGRIVFAVPLLIIVLLVQLYDYKLLLGTEHIDNYHTYHPPIQEAQWRRLFEMHDTFIFYPPFESTYLKDTDYRYFCYLAADYHKPIDLGYAARSDNKSIRQFEEGLKRDINHGKIGAKTLFITTPNFAGRFLALYQSGLVGHGQLDGYDFFYPKAMEREDWLRELSKSTTNGMDEKLTLAPFTLTQRDHERNMPIELEQIDRSSLNISIRGWLPYGMSNEATSYAILLRSDQNVVFKSPPVWLAHDSASIGRNGLLDSLVFAGTYFTEGIAPGNYEVGLYLQSVQEQQQVGAYQFFGSIPVGYDNYFQPIEWKGAPYLRVWIDVFEESETEIKVDGWAFFHGQSSFSNRIEVVLKSNDQIYLVPTDPKLRHDLTSYFNSDQNLSTGGFISFISKRGLAKGDYDVGIRVVNEKTHQEGIQYTDRSISIK